MNIINNGRVNRLRKGGLPSSVKNNKDFVFGVSSYTEPKHPEEKTRGNNSMHNIIGHSDNMRDDLARKINKKIQD